MKAISSVHVIDYMYCTHVKKPLNLSIRGHNVLFLWAAAGAAAAT